MALEIIFSEQYSYVVQVFSSDMGDLGEATLLFGANHWPQLRFENWQTYSQLGDGKKFDRLQAISKIGEKFTLFDCSVVGHHMSIDYVIAGDVKAKFKSIGIRFNDISEWFTPLRSIEEKIKSNLQDIDCNQNISATITSDEHTYNLFSEPVVRVKKSGEDHIIHEHIVFTFELIDEFFSIKDIKKKSHELATLLSILAAIPIYLVSIQVVDNDNNKRHVFFPSIQKKEQSTLERTRLEYFTPKSLLDGRWQTIIENYYKSEFREILWVRLAGMQHYEGFWEYKALGYVSLLDKYVHQCTTEVKKKKAKSEDIKNTKFYTALQAISPPLTAEQENSVFTVITDFFMSSKKLSFQEKYDHVLKTIEPNILSIINLSNDDFRRIKKIRDAIAHGNPPELIETGNEKIDTIVSKIALLLTYWSLIDFGLTNDDFLACLRNHSQLHRRSDINRVELARATKTAGFFNVSKEQFDNISQKSGIKINSCFWVDNNGFIEYTEEHVTALKTWLDKGISGIIPVAEIFGKSIEKIKIWDHAYIECDSERLELFHAYFIDRA
ncbi:HEPN domain-containing protein [Chromobacterium rhizoryzae]|uniref:HEPN domain-containing protein n=1 Tax=Chromobacterium rhizoryzae TaxID=1778675 RepID=UPI001D075344|nr:HEPN domain-containing protein [Chromobacterium rhizoryzae]